MSESENNPQAKIDNRFNESLTEEINELRSSLNSFQSLVSSALLLILVFSVCINIYMGMQMMLIRDEVHKVGSTTEHFITETAPNINEFYNRLNDYATKHPEFRPVLSKYDQFFREHGMMK